MLHSEFLLDMYVHAHATLNQPRVVLLPLMYLTLRTIRRLDRLLLNLSWAKQSPNIL